MMVRMYPSPEEFLRLSRSYARVPVVAEFRNDSLTPATVFKILGKRKYSFILESVERGERLGRYSFIGFEPMAVFKSRGRRVEITREGGDPVSYEAGNPFEELRALLKGMDVAPRVAPGDTSTGDTSTGDTLPGDEGAFLGGAVGYSGYNTVGYIEEIPDSGTDDLMLPDMYYTLTDSLIVIDHVKNIMKVVVHGGIDKSLPWDGERALKGYESARDRIGEILAMLNGGDIKPVDLPDVDGVSRSVTGESDPCFNPETGFNLTKEEFMRMVLEAKEHIYSGDIFQVVLSQRLSIGYGGDPFDLYRSLRSTNPSPYMFYLDYGDFQVVGSSPEMMVKLDGRRAEIRPIAGTRPRGRGPFEEAALAEELLNDEKEISEHVMLVDLGRNDLGRVCRYGSIRVEDPMHIERYSHVMHIVTSLSGEIMELMDQFDLFMAAFPAGTVSGAPKVRAMEIIDRLEPTRRGIYAGAVGYFGYSGSMDTCIAIRTMVVKDGRVYIQAGAGIVADSDPEREYEETLNKAKALKRAVEICGGVFNDSCHR